MHVIRPLILAAMIGVGQPISARTIETRSMSLDDCIQQALQHNLDIQIEERNPLIANYNVGLARAGYDPQLRLSGQHDQSRTSNRLNADNQVLFGSENEADRVSGGLDGLLPWGMTYSLDAGVVDRYGQSLNPLVGDFSDASGVASATLAQPLLKNLWIDSTRLRVAQAKIGVQESGQGFRQRVMDIMNAVENAYYDLIFARENVKVQQMGKDLARQLLADNQKRVELGALAPLDERQAEAAVAAREADLLSAENAAAIQDNRLKSLLTDSYSAWQNVLVEPAESLSAEIPVLDLQDSWSKGLEQRPVLVQARLQVEGQGIQLRFDKNQMFPQLDLFGTYGHNASSGEISGLPQPFKDGDNPFWTYGARMTLPLSNTAARNQRRANQAGMEQLLLTLKRTEQDIMVEVDNAVKQVRTSYRRVDATRQARSYAEEALEAEQEKLDNGKSTSFVVLQLQRDLTSARFNEISALTDYNKALAALARSEGTTLERHNIVLDIE